MYIKLHTNKFFYFEFHYHFQEASVGRSPGRERTQRAQRDTMRERASGESCCCATALASANAAPSASIDSGAAASQKLPGQCHSSHDAPGPHSANAGI